MHESSACEPSTAHAATTSESDEAASLTWLSNGKRLKFKSVENSPEGGGWGRLREEGGKRGKV